MSAVDDAVAELQQMAQEIGAPPAAVIGPDPEGSRPPSPSVPIDAPEPAPQRRYRCGWGGGCGVWLDRRSLCPTHAEAIRALGVARSGTPRGVPERAPAEGPAAKPRQRRRTRGRAELAAGRRRRVEAVADIVADVVAKADTHPVQRPALAEAAGVNRFSHILTDAINKAEADGHVRVVTTGGNDVRGLYPNNSQED